MFYLCIDIFNRLVSRRSTHFSQTVVCDKLSKATIKRNDTAPSQATSLLLFAIGSTVALNDGLALTPPMGWRSYNAFGGSPTQARLLLLWSLD